MLNKRRRLRSKEVDQVLAKGRSARSNHLQIKFLPGAEPIRTAAVVPKSLARKASARNPVRRALYRALAAADRSSATGTAVFFVRAIPPTPLAPAFAKEIPALLSHCN